MRLAGSATFGSRADAADGDGRVAGRVGVVDEEAVVARSVLRGEGEAEQALLAAARDPIVDVEERRRQERPVLDDPDPATLLDDEQPMAAVARIDDVERLSSNPSTTRRRPRWTAAGSKGASVAGGGRGASGDADADGPTEAGAVDDRRGGGRRRGRGRRTAASDEGDGDDRCRDRRCRPIERRAASVDGDPLHGTIASRPARRALVGSGRGGDRWRIRTGPLSRSASWSLAELVARRRVGRAPVSRVPPRARPVGRPLRARGGRRRRPVAPYRGRGVHRHERPRPTADGRRGRRRRARVGRLRRGRRRAPLPRHRGAPHRSSSPSARPSTPGPDGSADRAA